MCSRCEANVNLNMEVSRVINVSTFYCRTTWDNSLCTSGSVENSRIGFMLFHIIMADTIQSFAQNVSGTELDMLYLTAAF